MKYSKKNSSQQKFYIFGIWNMQGIFQKYSTESQFFLFLIILKNMISIPFFSITTFFGSLLEYEKFQKNCITTEFFLEYGIFQEYYKKYHHNKNIGISGIWNIPGILKKTSQSTGA